MTSNRSISRTGPKQGFVAPIRVQHRGGRHPGLPISSRMTASGHNSPASVAQGSTSSGADRWICNGSESRWPIACGLAIRGPGRGPVTANPSKRFAVKFAEASSFYQAVQSARRGWGVAEGRPLRDLLVMYSRSHTGVGLVRHATEPPPLGRSYLWTHGDLHL